MSAPTAVLDRMLHLSLPDWRTALKRRVKRPRRPQWFWLVFAAFYAGCGIFAHTPLELLACCVGVGYGLWAAFSGRHTFRTYLPAALAIIAFSLADLVVT